ncbi:peptidase, S41 family [Metamycoplasma arthritidis]|uniref:Conserved hypothetical lipoprotein n=1 Tax=Metamycoplasma arthritidis (strain 158L3-1) TaxID=243272 RepID=B3PMQ5_META1|nr:S41 family peptidase [Metamycoplasma arthritidis]ACF07307.1 conserved hypothetical lipoprotein [Metamycoplasma arthritidis 158L3-1]VEU78828.1 peptidase, S41 family [Metamycoplasma arthritidis]
MRKISKLLLTVVGFGVAVSPAVVSVSCKNMTLADAANNSKVDVINKQNKLAREVKKEDVVISNIDRRKYKVEIDELRVHGNRLFVSYKVSYVDRNDQPYWITKEVTGFKDIEEVNHDAEKVERKEYGYKNINMPYSVPATKAYGYYVNNKSRLYVDVEEFIKTLDGFYNLKALKREVNQKENIITYYSGPNFEHKMVIDWANQTIWISSIKFFLFTNTEDNKDRNEFIHKGDYKTYDLNNGKGFLIDLKKYGFDIKYHKKQLLMPWAIFAVLFIGINYRDHTSTYFDGKQFYSVDYWRNNRGEMRKLRAESPLNGKPQTLEDRQDVLNQLYFMFDYFYGLKEHNKVKSYKEFMTEDIKKKILSLDPYENFKGMYEFISSLKDAHSNLASPNNYAPSDQKYAEKLREEISKNAKPDPSDPRRILSPLWKKYRSDGKIMYVKGDTAIFDIPGFSVGTKEELASPTPWKYDTHAKMKKVIEEVKKYNNDPKNKVKIKNLVLDLSLNGGGDIPVVQKTLGFMTKKPVYMWDYDIASQKVYEDGARIDTNGDGKIDDNDGHLEFNWYVLAGKPTFSAASQFVALVQNQKLAKVIGQRTGGGMAEDIPLALADGTAMRMSSTYVAVIKEKYQNGETKWVPIESGTEADIPLAYEDFYNDEKIVEAINRTNK